MEQAIRFARAHRIRIAPQGTCHGPEPLKGATLLRTVRMHSVRIDPVIRTARAEAARGLPAVRGELVEGDAAGYHYYPGRGQAVEWITHQGLTIVDEAFRWENGWGYRHFLLHTGG